MWTCVCIFKYIKITRPGFAHIPIKFYSKVLVLVLVLYIFWAASLFCYTLAFMPSQPICQTVTLPKPCAGGGPGRLFRRTSFLINQGALCAADLYIETLSTLSWLKFSHNKPCTYAAMATSDSVQLPTHCVEYRAERGLSRVWVPLCAIRHSRYSRSPHNSLHVCDTTKVIGTPLSLVHISRLYHPLDLDVTA